MLAVRSVAELIAALDAGARPEYLMFWGHTARETGHPGPWLFSQWWPQPFESDGQTFASAEHFMMWRKARLFGDDAAAASVLRAPQPAQAKSIGREVSGFDETVWAGHRWQIVVDGSVAKFGTDPVLREYLLATGSRVLVEASPVDRIWGIGLSADSPAAADPRRWRGLNLLGFALMEARHRLAKT